ncbi:MAG: hypothetical protein IPP57_10700 [Candidatus Obscuribacter sp.]|nr:hypothetical protein [Candidatus Obscuribacter sp.]MBK9618411.1 hypothetical protein [Candidatus Obscuribacter sp.]MBK9771276.1 hypothetical protein [Candidatus Obscuribacter sp.]MDQ5968127.1 hypothetical protein [Cyanobacteriota bacterium erpe_2018_sw_39hr_WHONDRS-SW48-000098_B_bin.30]
METHKLFYSQRKRRKHYVRFFFLFFVVMLNVSTIGSLVGRLLHHGQVSLTAELFQFVFNLALDLYILPSLLLEADSVEVDDQGINIKVLLWQSQLKFADVQSFQVIKYFTWAILKTRRCFYLINRRDLPNFDELLVILSSRVPFNTEKE